MNTKFGRYYPALGGKTNERERLLFIAAAGLAFSLLVVLFVVFSFSSRSDAKEVQATQAAIPQAIGTVTLLTPDRVVRAGTRLSEVSFKEVYWPRNQVPDGAVRDIEEMKSLFAKVDLQPGVPVQRTQLAREAVSTTLPVTPGNRAVSFEVDATSSVEGHVLPGTKVDVVLTFYENGNLASKVIVQNARVLSYGGDFTPIDKRTQMNTVRAASRTITLDVTPKDALQITTARQLGRLSLIMRSSDDEKGNPTTEWDAQKFDDPTKAREKRSGSSCMKGTVKMAGKEYLVSCDGTINEVVNPNEP
ncbi:MAG: Flp pilus assembly protein CpaB [Oligoflexia bacterium]|nr:Flp pilus assembly protein CpaB [Oligoflexia bacterium]